MRPINGGKEDREHAAKLRKQLKRGKTPLDAEETEWLAAWNKRIADMPKGRPLGGSLKVQQPEPETVPGGGADIPASPPIDPPQGSAPPADLPPLEAPPRVAPAPKIAEASGTDWRAKYRTSAHVADDGRQMVCETIADGWIGALDAMASDLRKAKIDPLIDPKQMRAVVVLAVDEILPPRVKMTPKIAAALGTSVVIGQRYWHHKKVTEALKGDPEHVQWREEQAARERKEAELAAKNRAEVAAKKEPQSPAQYAAPPPPPEAPPPSINGHKTFVSQAPVARGTDADGPLV